MIGTILGLMIIGSIVVTVILRLRKLDPGYDVWIIKKGRHWAKKNNAIFAYKFAPVGKVLRFEAFFGDGCDYVDESGGDVNKLYGVSYGLDNHWRSVRIGWTWNENLKVIELFVYTYRKGKRDITGPICRIPLFNEIRVYMTHFTTEERVLIEIFDVDSEDEFGKFEKIAEHSVYGIDKSWINIKQYPYFGGDHKAPQDMEIFIGER